MGTPAGRRHRGGRSAVQGRIDSQADRGSQGAPERREPDQVSGTWAEALQDDSLGFHLARDFDLREIGLLYYVAASSGTIAEAFAKAERYCRLANEGISLRFAAKEMTITLKYIGVERRSDRHQIEFWLTSIVRMNRALTNRRLIPSRLKMVHRRRTTPTEVRSFLGCEIEFGSDVDEIAFPVSVGPMPIESADHYLNDLLVTYCEQALAHRKSGEVSLRSSVENAIAPLLPHREARVEEIARRLGMSSSHAGATPRFGGTDLQWYPRRDEDRPCQELSEER
ncbi:AraC family transcriptional regulator ligand-binding domain-containing protein [Bradyrhizobium japonicum]